MNTIKCTKHVLLLAFFILPILFASCDGDNQAPNYKQHILRDYVWKGIAKYDKESGGTNIREGDVTLVFMSGGLKDLNPKTTVKDEPKAEAGSGVEEGIVYLTYSIGDFIDNQKGTYRFENGALRIVTYYDIEREPWLKKAREFIFMRKDSSKGRLHFVNINDSHNILKELILSPVTPK
ncbi:hypothetical protein [Porphyromonas sp.]|uniref:hypothetical protein n=1 Tax=Porphyromonas sp. TaxID=1924944 RepID=UPI0026DACB3A|nr:hypothetical protein [Porphyromonas sp.]MDO4771190.1 hypothetical protein [Porphyromonas sp.]